MIQIFFSFFFPYLSLFSKHKMIKFRVYSRSRPFGWRRLRDFGRPEAAPGLWTSGAAQKREGSKTPIAFLYCWPCCGPRVVLFLAEVTSMGQKHKLPSFKQAHL